MHVVRSSCLVDDGDGCVRKWHVSGIDDRICSVEILGPPLGRAAFVARALEDAGRANLARGNLVVNRAAAIAYFGRVSSFAVRSSPHELVAIRDRAGRIQFDYGGRVCSVGYRQRIRELQCAGLDCQCCPADAVDAGYQKANWLIPTPVLRPWAQQARINSWRSQTQQFGTQVVVRQSVVCTTLDFN